jgi:acyl-CoA oxidase
VTYEGDNYVIGQQVPRAILKHYHNKTESSLPSISYLSILRNDRTPPPPADPTNPASWTLRSLQQWALEHRLVSMVRQHMADTAAGVDTSYTTHALTMAHSDFTYFRGLWSVIDSLPPSTAFLVSLQALAQVFSLSILYNPHHPSLAQHLHLTPPQLVALRSAYQSALDHFAGGGHVAAIVNAYGLTEYEMDSALARADQTPYEALLEGAKKSEMSGEKMSHLWPMMVDTRRLWQRIEEEEGSFGKAKL